MAKKYIDADKLKAEIERQMRYAKNANYPKGSIENERATAIVAVCLELLSSLDTLSEEPDNSLEEEVKNYFQGHWPGTETAEQCNTDLHFTPLAIMRLARHFANWQKEQMMKEAVEGIVHPYDSKIWVNLIGYGYKFNDGDKVRIIVLPKED